MKRTGSNGKTLTQDDRILEAVMSGKCRELAGWRLEIWDGPTFEIEKIEQWILSKIGLYFEEVVRVETAAA